LRFCENLTIDNSLKNALNPSLTISTNLVKMVDGIIEKFPILEEKITLL
jgi:hypothetical protein